MRHTNRETSTQTLARLITALDKHHPVTITYLKEETRDVFAVNSRGVATRRTIKTGRLIETIRTIEIHNVFVSQAGDILVRAMDRETGEVRSFRLDRIQAYTVHRTAYLVETPAVDAAESRTVGLATVTVLYPVDLPIAGRVQLLADALAA